MRIWNVALGLVFMSVYAGAVQEPLTLVRAIDLPHVEGRIDHLAFDAATQRLYVAALGNNTVEVLDTAAGSHLKSLPGFREPQGIAVVSDIGSVAVANGQGDGLQLISAENYRPGAMIRIGDDADNVRYDASAKRACTSGLVTAPSPPSTRQPRRCSVKRNSRDIRNRSSWNSAGRVYSSTCRQRNKLPLSIAFR